MANWISRAWRAALLHRGGRYFLLPRTESELPGPAHEGPFGVGGAAAADWFNRVTRADGHTTPAFYVAVGVVLAVITLLELWVFTIEELGAWFAPLLLVLAAVKFLLVVAFFMHLRFDRPLLSWVFGAGLAIAIALFVILLVLFGQFHA